MRENHHKRECRAPIGCRVAVLCVTWLLASLSGACARGAPPLRPVAVGTPTATQKDALLAPQVIPHNEKLTAAAVSPDGTLIALGDYYGFVLLLDVVQQRLISRLPVHAAAVSALTFRNGAGSLLSTGEDGRLCVINVQRNSIERCNAAGRDSFDFAGFSADARHVAGASMFEAALAIWSTDGGPALYSKGVDTRFLAMSSNAEYIATPSELCRLSTVSLSCVSLDDKLGTSVSAVAFDPDDNLIISADAGLTWLPLTKQHARSKIAKSLQRLPEATSHWWDALSFGLSYLARLQGQHFDTIIPLCGGRAIGITGNHQTFLVSDFGSKLQEFGAGEVAAVTPDGHWVAMAGMEGDHLGVNLWDANESVPAHVASIRADARSPGLVKAISNRAALIMAGDYLWSIDWPTMTVLPILHIQRILTSVSANGDLALEQEAFSTAVVSTSDGHTLLTLESKSLDDRPPLVMARGATSAVLRGFSDVLDSTTGRTLVSFVPPEFPWRLATQDFDGTEWRYSANTLTISPDGRRVARRLEREHWGQPRTALQILNAGDGTEIGRLLFWGGLAAVALSPHGQRVLAAVWDEEGDSSHRWTVFGGHTPDELNVRLFDADNGDEILQLKPPWAVGALTFAPDEASAYVGGAGQPGPIRQLDLVHGKWMDRSFQGHLQTVRDIAVAPDGKHFVSISDDGTARVWNAMTSESVALVFLGNDWLAYTDDGYFDSSRHGEHLVSAFSKGKMFPLEQLAVRSNRPDLLIERMITDTEGHLESNANDAIGYFRDLYRARLRRLELHEDQLGTAFASPPTAAIIDIRCAGNHADIVFDLHTDSGALTSYDLYANGVQLFGPAGRKVTGIQAHLQERIELTAGVNRMEITARSSHGLESLRDTRNISCPVNQPKQIYYLGFGISTYEQPTISGTKFADDDARALGELFKRAGARTKIFTNKEVTPDAIRSARDFLREATVNDTVVILIAGHGQRLHERDAEYVFLTYQSDPARLRDTAAPISMFDALFADVLPRERLLLIDSCESGDDMDIPPSTLERMNISNLLTGNVRERYIYNDITRRTGTVVFSATRGYERSAIDERIKHGFFTSAVLDALHGAADIDHDGRVSLEELRTYVSDAVLQHNPSQHPTIDRENRSANFTLPVVAPK